MLRPLLRKLNIYEPGKVFHAIRHTAGSIMLESGATVLNVQKQLRHSSATVTHRATRDAMRRTLWQNDWSHRPIAQTLHTSLQPHANRKNGHLGKIANPICLTIPRLA